MGKVIINTRRASGLLCKFKIFVDGNQVGKMKQNSTESFEVGEGNHFLQVRDTGLFKKSNKEEFTIKEKEIVTFNVSIKFFGYSIEQEK